MVIVVSSRLIFACRVFVFLFCKHVSAVVPCHPFGQRPPIFEVLCWLFSRLLLMGKLSTILFILCFTFGPLPGPLLQLRRYTVNTCFCTLVALGGIPPLFLAAWEGVVDQSRILSSEGSRPFLQVGSLHVWLAASAIVLILGITWLFMRRRATRKEVKCSTITSYLYQGFRG